MHYAFPQKGTRREPWAVKRKGFRQQGWQVIAASLASVVIGLYLLSKLLGGLSSSQPEEDFTKAPFGQPNVVLVTTIDPHMHQSLTEAIKRNRMEYAERHGYATFFPSIIDYPINGAPSSWAKVPAMRHAMTLHPKTPYFFFTDSKTLIMNHDMSVEEHVMNAERLEHLMLQDVSIIPPDSVIKTFPRLKGEKIDFVLAQDREGLMINSFILRRGEWAKFFLDVWFDPIYRNYNFQRAERHALEHIVQWHGTLLAKLGLVPQNTINSIIDKDSGLAGDNGVYKEGDFVIYMGNCDSTEHRNCETEIQQYLTKFKSKDEGR